MNKKENVVGFILLIVLLIAGKTMLASNVLFIRLLFGLGLGYTLSRAYTGFAGSVNRAYNTGSTRLMRTLMLLFFLTALASTGYFFLADASQFDLWVNPINTGLILGGILFGFGMAFSSCCASGVLTDLVTALPRAGVTFIFFCMGVFLDTPYKIHRVGLLTHGLHLKLEKHSVLTGSSYQIYLKMMEQTVISAHLS